MGLGPSTEVVVETGASSGALTGPTWRWLVQMREAGGYGRRLCSIKHRGAAALELTTLAREGLWRSGEAGDGHGKAREARILQIRWRSACGGRRRATQPWKLLLSAVR